MVQDDEDDEVYPVDAPGFMKKTTANGFMSIYIGPFLPENADRQIPPQTFIELADICEHFAQALRELAGKTN